VRQFIKLVFHLCVEDSGDKMKGGKGKQGEVGWGGMRDRGARGSGKGRVGMVHGGGAFALNNVAE